jgi:Zn-dependent peptidase ImmA (M78 family)
MRSFEITLGGETWTVRWVTRKQMPKNDWGHCFWDEKLILVRKDLSLQNRLDTLIHELRHAQHKVMFEAEEFIDSTSTELAIGILASGILTE